MQTPQYVTAFINSEFIRSHAFETHLPKDGDSLEFLMALIRDYHFILDGTDKFPTKFRHIGCQSEEVDIEGFRQNPKNRCYLCRHGLLEKFGMDSLEGCKQNGASSEKQSSGITV